MSPKVATMYEMALAAPQPVTRLREMVQARIETERGYSRADAFEELSELREELMAGGKEAEEEAVAEVMDMLEGWGPEHQRLIS